MVLDLGKIAKRQMEWYQFGVFPGGQAGCIINGCGKKGSNCRETPEGVLCLEHYEILPECDEIIETNGVKHKCGQPSVMGLGWHKHTLVPRVLCREHYCGPITEEYLEKDRQHWGGIKSPMGLNQEEDGCV